MSCIELFSRGNPIFDGKTHSVLFFLSTNPLENPDLFPKNGGIVHPLHVQHIHPFICSILQVHVQKSSSSHKSTIMIHNVHPIFFPYKFPKGPGDSTRDACVPGRGCCGAHHGGAPGGGQALPGAGAAARGGAAAAAAGPGVTGDRG